MVSKLVVPLRFGGSVRVKDNNGHFYDTVHPAVSPYPPNRKHL